MNGAEITRDIGLIFGGQLPGRKGTSGGLRGLSLLIEGFEAGRWLRASWGGQKEVHTLMQHSYPDEPPVQ